jgi:hypothetical protein
VLICLSIQIETFTGTHKTSLQIGHLRKQVLQHDEVVPSVPSSQYNKIIAFLKYMDSLAGSVSGRKIYDSIIHIRPGLLDSAKLLEKLYHNQNKSQ